MYAQLKTLAPYLRRYKRAYFLGAFCILGSVFLRLLVPQILGDSINDLEGFLEGESPGSPTQMRTLVTRHGLSIFAIALAGALLRATSRLSILGTCRRVAYDLRRVLFERLMELSPSFFVRNPTGQIMSRAINDMGNVQGLMGPVILYLAETACLYVIGITLMMRISVSLTVIGLLPFPFFLVAARKIAVKIQTVSRQAQNSLAEVGAKVDESLSGQAVVKSMALEDIDFARFEEHAREYRELNLTVTRHRALLIPMMMSLAALSTLAVLIFGGPKVSAGEMQVGDIIKLILFLGMFAGPTRTLGFVISSLRRGTSALQRIRELTDAEVTLPEPENPVDLPSLADENAPPPEVQIRGLSIVYPPLSEQPHLEGAEPPEFTGGEDVERTVLSEIDVTVPPGKTLGIVGHVGSGKTTLARAIGRQIEIAPDQLFIDGIDITRLRKDDHRRLVGYVPQDPFLFSATMADNVALGRADATRPEIEEAVRAAQLESDLDQLPEGLDTVVGERGVRLSGGQRQRTALARVLLLQPRILVLDDTLSAVDTITADAILEVLRPFASRRTTILISHRLSTLNHADEIIVLDEGHIVERGTHSELLEHNGTYAEIWNRQEQGDERARFEEKMRAELEAAAALDDSGGSR